MPKAVRHTHGSFAVAVRHWRDALHLSSADRMQIMTPPSHILGLLNIVMALETGAWIRLHRRFDIDLMLHHIETDRITIEMAVAPIALALAAHPKLESYDLSSLRYIMWCATPVTPSVAEAVTRRTGVNWVTAYGTSELVVIACNEIEGARLDTVGRPVPEVRAADRVAGGRRAAVAGCGGRDPGALGFGDGGLPAGFGYGRGIFGRLVPDGRRRLPRRRRLAADHRPRQGNDQGAGLSGRARRDRGRAARASRPSKTARCSGCPTRRTERPSSPQSRRAGRSRPTSSSRLSGTGWRRTSDPTGWCSSTKYPRLPSGKVLRRVLKERLWTSV